MKSFLKVGIVCIMMLAPTMAWATHPFTVEDTATEGKGNFLFELTGDHEKDGSVRTTKEIASITAGAGEHVDLSIEAPYLRLDPSPVTGQFASGKGDVRIKLKQQLFENEVKQSMAYQIYADLPTGDQKKGLGTRNVFWGVNLIDTQECHSNAFHLNAGYEVRGRDMKKWHYAHDYAFTFGFAVEHKFTESFRFVTEIAGESRKEVDEAADTQMYSRPFTWSAGLIYDISTSWYVDLGGGVGLNKYAMDQKVLVGTAWRF